MLARGFILLIRDLYSNPKAVGVGAHATEWMSRSQDNLQEPAQHWVLGSSSGFKAWGRQSSRPCLSVNTLHSSSVCLLFFSLEIPYFNLVLQKYLGELGGFKVVEEGSEDFHVGFHTVAKNSIW